MSLLVILEAGEEAALIPLATYHNACPVTPKASFREQRKSKAALLETSARTKVLRRAGMKLYEHDIMATAYVYEVLRMERLAFILFRFSVM